MGTTRARVAVAVATFGAAIACSGPASAGPPAVAHPIDAIPEIGALFLGDTPLHTCSGSVLDSVAGDLIITAAHCVVGPGVGISFAPAYANGISRFGVWTLTQIFVDPQWTATQDPQHDFAIARVARDRNPSTSPSIESVVGGGLRIAAAPQVGTDVSIVGYALGLNDRPVSCTAPARAVDGYSSSPCTGFVDGTSGGPWVVDDTVTGVIGGRDQGGCNDQGLYSSAFGENVRALLHRAENATVGDVAVIALLANRC